MSTETPDSAHDPAQRRSERRDDDAGESGRKPDTDDELVVVVCPHRIYERLRSELDDELAAELDEWRVRPGRADEREAGEREADERQYEDLLAECTQLEDEVADLERRLQRKESQLAAVVTHNEQLLQARTESYRRRLEAAGEEADDASDAIVDGDSSSDAHDVGNDDDFQWTGRRQESGLLARLKNWFR